jgi:hypothetical protein
MVGDSCASTGQQHVKNRKANGSAGRLQMASTSDAGNVPLPASSPSNADLRAIPQALLERLPTPKHVFIDFHIDPLASKLYALHAEPKALFRCGFTPELDFATGTHDALPR